MEFKDLLQFVDKQDKKLIASYEYGHDREKRFLARATKLAEETGELCSEVLSYNKNQRAEKLIKHNDDSLAAEIADVLITTLLIAKTAEVDVIKALEEKIKKIDQRFKDF